jgi:hypothetical protein
LTRPEAGSRIGAAGSDVHAFQVALRVAGPGRITQPVGRFSDPQIQAQRYLGWDIVVAILAMALGAFLLITMGVRRHEEALVQRCQDRLMAVSHAQQAYLVANGEYTEDITKLRPYLDDKHKNMPFLCPITGHRLEMAVQGARFIVLAPYTGYSVNTGDASW